MARRIELPPAVREIIGRLERSGHAAYAVGGCVRDVLRGAEPSDWDVCTSALPDETARVFSDRKTIDVGRKHGTIAVLFGAEKYEITTFRRDGEYDDARHPRSVDFSADLAEDLKRRDFTINAMAAGARGEVVDLFGGERDLEGGIIRCVGDPSERFSEDALRILRALRFASTLGFSLDPATDAAAREKRGLIAHLSGERILAELMKLLAGERAEQVLMAYPDVLAAAIPEISPCVGFEHRNSWHCFDVWEHTCRAIALAPRADAHTAPPAAKYAAEVRLALLFHDLAKPLCAVDKPNGHRSFHGHPEKSAEMARERLAALHAPSALRDETAALVLLHDEPLSPEPSAVGEFLCRLGEDAFFKLCDVQLADALAHNLNQPGAAKRVEDVRASRALAERLVRERAPYRPQNLAIRGGDLAALGFSGEEIGDALKSLCAAALRGEVENEREPLIKYAEKLRKGGDLR